MIQVQEMPQSVIMFTTVLKQNLTLLLYRMNDVKGHFGFHSLQMNEDIIIIREISK